MGLLPASCKRFSHLGAMILASALAVYDYSKPERYRMHEKAIERQMYQGPITTTNPAVKLHEGFPEAIDSLANTATSPQSFLRSAWYRAWSGGSGQTMVVHDADGAVIAAVPTTKASPALPGLRTVPGCYWPFRSVLVADSATEGDLVEAFSQSLAIKALAPVWRMGPVSAEDSTIQRVSRAATLAGWSVLQRPVGKSWFFDLASGNGLPGKSTLKRLRQYERRLAKIGRVSWRRVSGAEWDQTTLDQLGKVEEESWIGRATDGSGAKFLQPAKRARWRDVLRDSRIAEICQATILSLNDRPIAFSFDMLCETVQYAIACSFLEDMGQFRLGNIVTCNQLQYARERGIATVDLGAGDLGYKRQMGATEGEDHVDLLFVRGRIKAELLALRWGPRLGGMKFLQHSGMIAPSAARVPRSPVSGS